MVFFSIVSRLRNILLSPPVVALAFLILYALTAQRGYSWQDSGEFQFRIATWDVAWFVGIAVAHPGYILLGGLFAHALAPVLGIAFSATLFSSVCMAAALCLFGFLARRLAGSRAAALAATVALGLAHMAWWLSTVAEVYALSLALFFGELLLLLAILDRERDGRPAWLPWCALLFVNGVHFSVHNFALLDLAVYGVLALRSAARHGGPRAGAFLLTLAIAFLVGAAPVLWLAVGEYRGGSTILEVLGSIAFGKAFAGQVLSTAKVRTGFLVANYGIAALSLLLTPVWWFAFRGARPAALGGRRAFRSALLALTAIHALFWARYFVPDQSTFLLPTLGLVALWSALGLADAPRRTVLAALLAGAVLQVGAPALAVAVLRHPPFDTLAGRLHPRQLEGRDEAAYWLLPWKHNEDSADTFAKAAAKQMQENNGLLYADSTSATPLLILRAERGGAEGWRLFAPWDNTKDYRAALDDPQNATPLFVVSPLPSYIPPAMEHRTDLRYEHEGALHRVVRTPRPSD